MEVWVSAKPHMLYEAVELLYAYVNEIPAGSLTQEGEYCLTEEAVQQMMDVACAGCFREDPVVQYYFGGHVISEEPRRVTCMARNLAYNVMAPSRAIWPRIAHRSARCGGSSAKRGATAKRHQ